MYIYICPLYANDILYIIGLYIRRASSTSICVMHKCIMVKVGEKKITESMYKTRTSYEIRGKFGKGGGMKDLSETEGQWSERTKIDGEILNLWSTTKKISTESEKFFENRGKSETKGKC